MPKSSTATRKSRCTILLKWSLAKRSSGVLEAVERVNPSRIVFDSLSEIRLLAQKFGLHATVYTPPVCPSKLASTLPVAASQTFTV